MILAALTHGGGFLRRAGRAGLARLAGLGFGGGGSALGGDAGQSRAGGLVVRVLRHQLAPEGLGQRQRGKALGLGDGGGVAGFDAVGELEQGFDTADDFILLTKLRQPQRQRAKFFRVEVVDATGGLGRLLYQTPLVRSCLPHADERRSCLGQVHAQPHQIAGKQQSDFTGSGETDCANQLDTAIGANHQ